jgi:hypothetical protein
VRTLRFLLEEEAADPGPPIPGGHEEIVAFLAAARKRLRRHLLLAEGLDPDTGQLGA